MEDLKKYIGIPYGFNESSFEAADCAGLVSLFYREHGWPDDYPKPKTKDWYMKEPLYMQKYLMKNFSMTRDIDELTYGDILYYQINGEGHIGVYLNYGKFLSTYPKVSEFNGGCSFIDRCRFWFNMGGVKFIAGFRRKTGDN